MFIWVGLIGGDESHILDFSVYISHTVISVYNFNY